MRGALGSWRWVVLAMLVGGCASGPAYGPPSADTAAVISMTSLLNFFPATVTIDAGTVEWRNTSFFTHTVDFDPALAEKAGDVALPPSVEPFSSGPVPAGGIFHHSFTAPGTYRYICSPHHAMGMAGTIVVRP